METKPILLVEDNPINGKMIRVMLTNAGYEVKLAEDAEVALDILRNWQPRLILMDIQLPGMDGLELTRRLKADSQTRTITIIALTAYAMKGDEARALEAGCDGYITKPIDFQNCLERVAQCWAETPP